MQARPGDSLVERQSHRQRLIKLRAELDRTLGRNRAVHTQQGGESGIEQRLRRPTSRDGGTLMQWCYKQYVVAFDPAVWDSVSSGCRALGATVPVAGG